MFDLETLVEALLHASGGKLSKDYLEFINLPLVDAIYHIQVFNNLHEKISPQSASNKMKRLGLSLDDFEIVNG